MRVCSRCMPYRRRWQGGWNVEKFCKGSRGARTRGRELELEIIKADLFTFECDIVNTHPHQIGQNPLFTGKYADKSLRKKGTDEVEKIRRNKHHNSSVPKMTISPGVRTENAQFNLVLTNYIFLISIKVLIFDMTSC